MLEACHLHRPPSCVRLLHLPPHLFDSPASTMMTAAGAGAAGRGAGSKVTQTSVHWSLARSLHKHRLASFASPYRSVRLWPPLFKGGSGGADRPRGVRHRRGACRAPLRGALAELRRGAPALPPPPGLAGARWCLQLSVAGRRWVGAALRGGSARDRWGCSRLAPSFACRSSPNCSLTAVAHTDPASGPARALSRVHRSPVRRAASHRPRSLSF